MTPYPGLTERGSAVYWIRPAVHGMSRMENPYQTPDSNRTTFGSRVLGEAHPDFEKRVAAAYALLQAGRDHLGVINQLRSDGLSFEEAKAESYLVFDRAKRRLKRNQLPLRIIAWSLIALGSLGPLALLFGGAGFVIVTAIPIVGGFGILYRLPNPSRLPGG